jgi:hypothetical protein
VRIKFTGSTIAACVVANAAPLGFACARAPAPIAPTPPAAPPPPASARTPEPPPVEVLCPPEVECSADSQGRVLSWSYTTSADVDLFPPWNFAYGVDAIRAERPMARVVAGGVPIQILFAYDSRGRSAGFEVRRDGKVQARQHIRYPDVQTKLIELDLGADGMIDERVVTRTSSEGTVTECTFGHRVTWRMRGDFDASGRTIHAALDQDGDGQTDMELFVHRHRAGSVATTETVTVQGTRRARAWFRYATGDRLVERRRDDDGDGYSEQICRYDSPCPAPFVSCSSTCEERREPWPAP